MKWAYQCLFSYLQLLTLFVDPAAAASEKRKLCIVTACADIGVNVDFVPQRVERTISWCPSSTAPVSFFLCVN